MEQDERELSPKESLTLIHSMINQTRGEMANNSFYFLFWGWLVFTCCLGQFFLKNYAGYPYHYAVWWVTPVGGVISGIYSARQSKKQYVKTFVDESLKYLWI